MNYQRILNAYNPNYDLPGAGQPPVTWVEMQLAQQVQALTETVQQLRAELNLLQDLLQVDLRPYTHCVYCGERLGHWHQCPGTLTEDANAQAMRAYTLDERQRREDREATQ